MFTMTKMLSSKYRLGLSSQQVYQALYLCRTMSSCIKVGKIEIKQPKKVNHHQLLDLLKSNGIYVIDVREDKELKDTGVLPQSINIPVGEIEAALKLSNEQFETKYGKPKPDLETPLLFSCRSGKRSLVAYNAALALGFKQSMNYEGGWLEWEEKSIKKS